MPIRYDRGNSFRKTEHYPIGLAWRVWPVGIFDLYVWNSNAGAPRSYEIQIYINGGWRDVQTTAVLALDTSAIFGWISDGANLRWRALVSATCLYGLLMDMS